MDYVRAVDRESWRAILQESYRTAKELWLVYPNKAAGEPGVIYNDAVEEALCFGWIDSTVRRLDELHRVQRFTPRRRGSPYSRPNIERLILMEREGRLLPEVREQVLELICAEYVYPEDILAALRAEPETWAHFCGFSEPYRRIRVAYVDDARRRPEEFEKRLRHLIEKTRAGRLIVGYGGIDRYYR